MTLPYYELRCTSCQNTFNIKSSVQERSDQHISCPACTSHDLETVYRKVNILRYRNKDCDVCPGSGGFSAGGCGGACPGGRS